MGCTSNNEIGEENNENNTNSFNKLEKMLNSYKEAISKYKISIQEYEDIFEQQIKCEKLLKTYFSLQKNIILSNEPSEIKNYKKTFNRVNKLEDNLKIVPGIINKYQYDTKIKETEIEKEKDNEEYNNEKQENKNFKHKKKKNK